MSVKHYYVSGNTSQGFFSLFDSVVETINHLYLIKGDSLRAKSELLDEVGLSYEKKGYQVDYYHSPHHQKRREGVRIKALRLAFFDEALAQHSALDHRSKLKEIVNLNDDINQKHFSKVKEKVEQLVDERQYQYKEAYRLFSEAKQIHETKEDIYLSAMDFKKADKVAEKLIDVIYKQVPPKSGHGEVEEIFFGAATPMGAENFIDSLTADVKKRYIIKGRSGSGKSTLMRKVAEPALERGYSLTYFLCGLDPDSLDMIIIDELNLAILDGTSPHVIDPSRKHDEVVDMFELCIDPSVEEKEKKRIKACEMIYKEKMKHGTARLKKAAEIQDVIDAYLEEIASETERIIRKEGFVQKLPGLA
ncbi:hypothetical protein [Desertibacillus haloalkaliphilus]|uniref:hypothetical protein n=1 Tax=Desertibacillus haloalkaliphilus TaxID=1328930 RepID=UPI001C27F673|nr:hypothetical protein [Desertibacillus haloalkaliphilus]MBU8907444.1 hypothetical protein [Desertibacillus haloalkaliphilus]